MQNTQQAKWASVIVAAGSGQRFGSDMPKQYLPLMGLPVLEHSLKILESHGPVVIVTDPAHAPFLNAILKRHPGMHIVQGGKTRQDSVRNGLTALADITPQYVMIHDAARPSVTTEAIERLKTAIENGAQNATLSMPVHDTLMRGSDVIDRTGVHAIQTPQAFDYVLISKAHASAQTAYTDDSGLVAGETGKITHFIEGSADNFKITTQADLARAEGLLLARLPDILTGLGFDVHRFGDTPPDGMITLGGIKIPSDKSLVGHSDADVVLHAVADAILGTIAAGDIGQLFPPNDPQWKGMDSSVIVEKALELLHAKGGVLRHADIMILAEEPKIGPHRAAMSARLSQILGLKPDAVGLKATTMEKLGFIGRGEGLAVQAIVTVRLPL